MRPDHTLTRLQPVLRFHRHHVPAVHELLEQLRNPLLESRTIVPEIADEQVDERFGVRTHAVIDTGSSGQLADEEDQGAKTGAEGAVRTAVTLSADDFVVFTLQLPGVEEVHGDLVVDEVCRNDCADGGRGRLTRGIEDDLQLRA